MFAATMSMLSSDYNVCAGVLTNDVYRRLFRRNASGKELVTVGRLMTVVIGGFALAIAFTMKELTGEDLFVYMVTLFGIVTAPVGVPMILGLLSRRVTNLGVMIGWLCGIVTGLALFFCCPDLVEIEFANGKGAIFTTLILKKVVVIFTSTLIVTLFATLAVSLLVPMKEEERQRADAFSDRLKSPIGSLEEDRAAEGGTAFSPFGIVGVSVIFIGLMLLGVIPWVGPRESMGWVEWMGWVAEGADMAVWLTAGFSVVMVVIGGLMTWQSYHINK
jgi:hypothetical protein